VNGEGLRVVSVPVPTEAAAAPPSLLRIVATGAGTSWPPATDAEADVVLAQAAREGLLPLAFESAVPPVMRAALDRQRGHQRLAPRRAEILHHGLQAVARALDSEPFVVLKGADYAFRLYARPDLRPMQDLDLLVPRERLPAVCTQLERGGAQRRAARKLSARASSYHERAFLIGEVILEVHHAFVHRSRHCVDYDGLWARRVSFPAAGPSASRLDDVDALLAHALSLAKDEFSAPLVRYLDFALLLERAPLQEAAARARAWKAVRALFGALRQTLALMPELRTADRDAMLQDLLPTRARRFLERRVLPPLAEQGWPGVVTRRRQLWRKLWLMDDAGRRAAFALAHGAAVVEGAWRTIRERRPDERASRD